MNFRLEQTMNINPEQLVRMIDHTLLKNTAVKKDIELYFDF